MTVRLSSTLYQPTARGPIRRLALATVAALAIGAALGASTSRADTGEVYFDANNNAAAGDPEFLFNATFTGIQNVGLGHTVMPNLTSGSNNVATGTDALFTNETGNGNVATGFRALFQATGSRNIALGAQAGQNLSTGSNNIDIGNPGRFGESSTIRIGGSNQTAAYIAGISGTTLGRAAQPVVVKSNGQLGTAPARPASTGPLAQTVERLTAQLKRQQRQIERLRAQVKGG